MFASGRGREGRVDEPARDHLAVARARPGVRPRRAWHGTNLRGSLRRVSAAEAAFRPQPARHNIWELALHCAYWKYTVRRRLLGEKRGSFPLAGSNFFRRPEGAPRDADWKRDVALLDETHRRLRERSPLWRPNACSK
jgi:hypothetical protein